MEPVSIAPTTRTVENVNDVNLVTTVMPLSPRTVQVSEQGQYIWLMSLVPVNRQA